ncbi:MlaD family protein [Mycobacterium sp. ACS4331]|uniref:MCE family protein n=1 Tax=Mycobacterium sp. ACS4331 TaxID=1834121 RepID=UPI0008020232|nr:MlaD family protein [Mycobacterium sp. ACS4331]OBF30125.1 mammalian cell entry protein [Mycobacterium sp. ACS4331]
MHLTRKTLIQMAVLTLVALVAGAVMVFNFMGLPAMLFGVGQYKVSVQLPEAGGLYPRGNVTFRGTEVGRVKDVRLTDNGVVADLAMDSNFKIPADLDAAVGSVSAVGEQYVELMPRTPNPPFLKEGDVIPVDRTFVPPDVNSLLDATNRGLQAIPHDNLKTVVDESYTAFGGLGPELSRLVKGSTQIAIDARANLDELTTLIDKSKPVLDSQTDTSSAVQRWAANLDVVTGQLKEQDQAVAGVLQKGAPAADEVRALFDRLQPSLPILLANLVSVGEVAVTYQPNIEQLLVLLPQGTAVSSATGTANRHTRQDYRGAYLSFNLNLNLPPPCVTGFLPAQQKRVPADVDHPDRPAGDIYCRIPQDSAFNVRGARNVPCVTRPGKRAPTVRMCESDEFYRPLNDGFAWKGDPNATLSGQAVPATGPGASPAPPELPPPPAVPAIAAAEYDPSTGTYVGPDGQTYTQSNLARSAAEEQTWQTMLLPPKGN